MLTRSYRTAASPYEQVTRAVLEIGATVRLTFPEPPAFNAMIDLAKQRTRRGPKGARLRTATPLYWVEQQEYRELALVSLNAAGWQKPATPWQRIAITKAHFRLHARRDPVERMAALKWPVDLLVSEGFLEDDADEYLTIETMATQEIARSARGVDLWIRRDA